MMIDKRLVGMVPDSKKIHCGECSAHVVLPGGKYRYDVRDRLTVTETFF